MIPLYANPAARGRRGAVKWVVVLFLVVLCAIAAHFTYTQYVEKPATAQAQATDTTANDQAAATQTDAGPKPSSKAPRVNEMESISNLSAEQH